MIRSRLHEDWCVGRVVLLDDQRLVPTLILSSVEKPFDPSQLIGEYWRRNWSVALSIALAAQRSRCVHDHEHCRKPGFASETLLVATPFPIETQGIDDRSQ